MNNFNLEELRINIDEIDSALVDLLDKRMLISKKVGQHKVDNNIEVLNIQRELEVIDKVSKNVKNNEFSDATKDIYFEIMRTSRNLQVNINNNKDTSFGLLGESLKHSISPKIHNSLFEYFDIPEKYLLFEIKPNFLSDFMSNLDKYQIKGINVTIPYKIDVMKYLDDIDKDAKNIGNVNTVKIINGKKVGYNTDFFGFSKLLELNDVSVAGKTVVILGNGGSSKTVKYYCEQNKANKIYIVSRNADSDSLICYDDLFKIDFDVLINTTPVGMYPNIDEMPIKPEILKPNHIVVDLIYNPDVTKLLKTASEIGCNIAVNGQKMLYYQGLKAQEIWGTCECNEQNVKIIENYIG